MKLWLGLTEAELLPPETSLKIFERLSDSLAFEMPLAEALAEPCAVVHVESSKGFQTEELWRRLWSEGRINKAKEMKETHRLCLLLCLLLLMILLFFFFST